MKALILIFLASAPLAAQSTDLTQRLDSIARYWVERDMATGLVAAVVRSNGTLLLKSYGKADVEWDVPMPLDAMFEIGSTTKQFTAVRREGGPALGMKTAGTRRFHRRGTPAKRCAT